MQKIPLTQGQFALVDDRDFCYLSQWKWCAVFIKKTNTYYAVNAMLVKGKRINIYMHRLILNAQKKQVVDHENHNTLDNQRENILLKTKAINNKNKRLCKKNTSGFNGVTKRFHGYEASIKVNEKYVYLGTYKNIDDAVKARIVADEKYGFHKNHGKEYLGAK